MAACPEGWVGKLAAVVAGLVPAVAARRAAEALAAASAREAEALAGALAACGWGGIEVDGPGRVLRVDRVAQRVLEVAIAPGEEIAAALTRCGLAMGSVAGVLEARAAGREWRARLARTAQRGGEAFVEVLWVPGGDAGAGGRLWLADRTEAVMEERRVRSVERRLELEERLCPAGFFEADLQGGDAYFSPRWQSMLGYEPGELAGSVETWRRLLHPDDWRWLAQAGPAGEGPGDHPYRHEFRLRRKDGSWVWIESAGLDTADGAGRLVSSRGFHVDVGDLRVAREELAQARRAVDKLGIVLIDWAPGIGWPVLRVTEAVRAFGYDPVDFTSGRRNLASVIHRDDTARVAAELEAAEIQRLERIDVEFRLLGRTGGTHWVELRATVTTDRDGGVTGYQGALRDASERRAVEETLRQKERLLEAFAERIPAALCQAETTRSGRTLVRFLSPGIENLLGVSLGSVLARPASVLRAIDRRDRRRAVEARRAAEETGRPTSVVFRRAGGGPAPWLRAHLIPRAEAGGRVAWTVMLDDVTELKALEEAATRAHEEAEGAARAKADFLATMSHEIRTPLQGLTGFLQLLDGTELDVEQRQYLEMAAEQVTDVTRLVNDVLDFSRLESGRVEFESVPFRPEAEVRAVCENLGPMARAKGLDLELTRGEGAGVEVLGDPLRLRQVLTNLIGNAVKFTEAGSVTVTLRSRPDGDGVVRVEAEVKDTGPGIPAESLPRLFDRFSQTDASVTRRFGGSGLGLAIVRELCRRMGGEVAVRSEVGRGSAFTASAVLRPVVAGVRAAGDTGVTDPVPPAGVWAEQHPLAIAVVDDNAVGLAVARSLLGRLGYRVDTFSSGGEVIGAVLADPAKYDLVLMDVRMPDIDGIEATCRIRAACPRWPTIAGLTADVLPQVRAACLAAGMQLFLTKPTRLEDLKEATRQAHETKRDHPTLR